MNRSKWSCPLSLIIFLVSFCYILYPTLSAAEDSNSWEFHIAPYAWLAGLDGKIATLPGLPPADVGVNFYDDILGNINGTFPGQNFTKVTSRTKNWIVSTAAFVCMLETDRAFIDGLAGIRYWSVDSELTLSGGPVGAVSAESTTGMNGLIRL